MQVLPMVLEEAQAILKQAIADGRDAAKFPFSCGLDTTDSAGKGHCLILGPPPPRLAEIDWLLGECPIITYGHVH